MTQVTPAKSGTGSTRRRYVLREADEMGQYKAKNGFTDKPKRAMQWASRLAARQASVELFGAKLATGWVVEPLDLGPERPKVPPPEMVSRDPLWLAAELWRLHSEACDRVEAWLERCGVERSLLSMPSAWATSRPTKWAGLYSSQDHACHYSLPCASLTLGNASREDYALIVKHEVAHAYQRALVGPWGKRLGHGGDWVVLMRRALGVDQPRATTSDYQPVEILGAARVMRREAERLASSGELASLQISVVTETVKRRGIG